MYLCLFCVVADFGSQDCYDIPRSFPSDKSCSFDFNESFNSYFVSFASNLCSDTNIIKVFFLWDHACVPIALRKTKEWCQWVASPQKRSTKTTYPWVPTPHHIITQAVCQSQCMNPTMCPWPRALSSSPPWANRSPHPPTWVSVQVQRPLLAGQCSLTASRRLWTEILNLIAKVRVEQCLHACIAVAMLLNILCVCQIVALR